MNLCSEVNTILAMKWEIRRTFNSGLLTTFVNHSSHRLMFLVQRRQRLKKKDKNCAALYLLHGIRGVGGGGGGVRGEEGMGVILKEGYSSKWIPFVTWQIWKLKLKQLKCTWNKFRYDSICRWSVQRSINAWKRLRGRKVVDFFRFIAWCCVRYVIFLLRCSC